MILKFAAKVIKLSEDKEIGQMIRNQRPQMKKFRLFRLILYEFLFIFTQNTKP